MKIEATSPQMVIVADSESDTDRIGRAVGSVVNPGIVIGLIGPLGAGKTRLTRAIAESLGASPLAVSSPTFVLIQEYEARWPLFHFDTYRLRSPEEFEALGPDEYFAGEGVCIVEWADRVAEQLPKSTWWIRAEHRGEARVFTMTLPDDVRESLDLALREDIPVDRTGGL